MILVYLDESGDTGLNFADEQQPIFVLGALLVPQSLWKPLEQGFLACVMRAFDGVVPDGFELHTMDLVNRKKAFQAFSLDQIRSFRNSLFDLLQEHGLRVLYRKIDKRRYQKYCETHFGKGIRIEPYIMSLPFLCTGIDRILESSGDLGILIFDHHHDLAGIEKTLRTLRIGDGGALRTERQIEKGFFVDSAQSFPIHQEVFPRLKTLATSLDSHDQGLEIIDWVGREHAKRVAIAPEGGAVS